MSDSFEILEIRLPQGNEFTPEAMSSLLSNFTQLPRPSFFGRLFGASPLVISLEIALFDNQIHFCLASPASHLEFFRSQILAQYPTALIKTIPDYLPAKAAQLRAGPHFAHNRLSLGRPSAYPLKTVRDFRDTDPLTSILSPLSRASGILPYPPYFNQ